MSYKTLGRIIKEVVGGQSQPNIYTNLDTAIKAVMKGPAKKIESDKSDQIAAGTYITKNFDASPAAQKYFTTMPKTVDANYVEKSAQFHDKLYGILKKVRTTGTADDTDVSTAELYQKNIEDMKPHLPDAPDPTHLTKEVGEIRSKLGKEGSPMGVKPAAETGDIGKDLDIDNKKFPVSRKSKMDRKIKIFDDD
jgi:hypothetical protein